MEGEQKQTQKSGSYSTNQQAGGHAVNFVTVHAGLSVSDAGELARQLFEENFVKLQRVAHDVATERAETITRHFIQQLAKHGNYAIQALVNPDVQASLYEVQTNYARSGRDDLGALL